MSLVVRFSPDLSAWLTQGLAEGTSPIGLVETMVEQRMDRAVASAIVEAFVAARVRGRPAPVDSVTIDETTSDYVYDTRILRPGSRIETSDRVVRVAARTDRPVLAVLHNVPSADECVALIERARPRLKSQRDGHEIGARSQALSRAPFLTFEDRDRRFRRPDRGA